MPAWVAGYFVSIVFRVKLCGSIGVESYGGYIHTSCAVVFSVYFQLVLGGLPVKGLGCRSTVAGVQGIACAAACIGCNPSIAHISSVDNLKLQVLPYIRVVKKVVKCKLIYAL